MPQPFWSNGVKPMCSPHPVLGHAGRHTVCPQSFPLVSVTSVLEVAAKTLRIYKGDAQTTEGACDISYPRLVLCISCLLSGPQNRMPCGLGLGGWSVTIPVRSKRGRPSSLCNPPLTWHGCPRPWRRHAESTWYVEQMVPPLKITMLYHTPRHSRGLRQKGVRVGVGAARCSHQPSVRGQMRMQPPGEHGPRGP